MFLSTQIGFGNISTSAGRLYPKTNAFWSALALIIGNLTIGIMSVFLVHLWLGQIKENGFTITQSNVTELFVLDVIYNMSVGTISKWSSVIGILGYVMVICAGITSSVRILFDWAKKKF